MSQSRIRNFCIVAHIDHGKSTLADRLIEATGAVEKRQMREQLPDTMDLERERGITIKLNAVRMTYTEAPARNTSSISSILPATSTLPTRCRARWRRAKAPFSSWTPRRDTGADAQQSLPGDGRRPRDHSGAQQDRSPRRRAGGAGPGDHGSDRGKAAKRFWLVSAKEGTGMPELLEAIVKRVPAPRGQATAPLRAVIFDSYYDRYRGAIPSIRVVDGVIGGDRHQVRRAPGRVHQVDEVGYYSSARQAEGAGAGEVGLPRRQRRTVRRRGWATRFSMHRSRRRAAARVQRGQVDGVRGALSHRTDQYESLRDALEKLQLNDASLQYEPETSTALGFGFRCGFLGLLHMEIVQERLEREFDLDLVRRCRPWSITSTAPTARCCCWRTPATSPTRRRFRASTSRTWRAIRTRRATDNSTRRPSL